MIMFSIILKHSPLCWALRRGKAMPMTVIMADWAKTASQFSGVRASSACRNGANDLLWYWSAVSRYDSTQAGSMAVAATCNAANERMPWSKNICLDACWGMRTCQSSMSDWSPHRHLKVSVENLCMSSRSRRPNLGSADPTGLIGCLVWFFDCDCPCCDWCGGSGERSVTAYAVRLGDETIGIFK